ncbi:MAG: polyprenyl synthetase family protein [Deltaproteobacteria bacterium]|nr:polyprenyl synthetase family protein [Deltaproteobacteria bacterium]
MKNYLLKGLEGVEERIAAHLRSDVALIHQVSGHLLSGGGKRIRPLLVILSARLCGYDRPELLDLASAVEFIHTASLLHDDVVDGSCLRRGRASANVIWGNEASVLVGDFLFARSFTLLVRFGNPRIMEILSGATEVMAKGEVLQLANIRSPSPDLGHYLHVVRCKTAGLMAAACRCGAVLGNADPEREAALEGFGLEIGMAFQFIDDLLDYVGEQDEFGKTPGSDLAEGKLTLPLLLALQSAPAAERESILEIVSRKRKTAAAFRKVVAFLERYDGIGQTRNEARQRLEKAKRQLGLFPDGTARNDLLELADFLMERRR